MLEDRSRIRVRCRQFLYISVRSFSPSSLLPRPCRGAPPSPYRAYLSSKYTSLQISAREVSFLVQRMQSMPHGSSTVCRHRAPCQPASVIETSVSLRRIDRACFPLRCDAHSDTSERHTFSHPPGRKTLSTRATRRRPHSKPLVGQACSLDVGERMAHALDGGEAKNTDGGRPLA